MNVPFGVQRRLGITAKEYREKQDAGEKYCGGCKAWHPVDDFALSSGQPDGRQSFCKRWYRAYLKKYNRRTYRPKPREFCSRCGHCRKLNGK